MYESVIEKIDILINILNKYHKDKNLGDMIPEDKKLLKEILQDKNVKIVLKNYAHKLTFLNDIKKFMI